MVGLKFDEINKVKFYLLKALAKYITRYGNIKEEGKFRVK